MNRLRTLTLAISCLLMLSTHAGVNAVKEEDSIGGDFILTDHNGETFDLKDSRGKLVLIFFGYTFCPDICPTELSTLAKLLKSLDADADKVNALFISVDPERDTVDKLKNYVPYFSPDLIGLTGSIKEINSVAEAYHVQRKIKKRDNKEYYFMDHSANLYVLGADGKILHLIPFGLPVEHIQQVVREEIKNLSGAD